MWTENGQNMQTIYCINNETQFATLTNQFMLRKHELLLD